MDEYFEWLCERIDIRNHINYGLLVTKLHKTPYQIITGMDVDARRARKARELRFYDDGSPVSCLEVLVSVAIDAEEKVMRDSCYQNRTAVWFWDMINNLGLAPYTDDNYNKYDVEEILDRFVNRKYQKNGKGSIAFTHYSNKDFRLLDIWQQFNIYLAENFICI